MYRNNKLIDEEDSKLIAECLGIGLRIIIPKANTSKPSSIKVINSYLDEYLINCSTDKNDPKYDTLFYGYKDKIFALHDKYFQKEKPEGRIVKKRNYNSLFGDNCE